MSLLGWFMAGEESTEQPYSAEVLCSNWVAPQSEQPVAPSRAAALERVREADTVTFLARIYATQRC